MKGRILKIKTGYNPNSSSIGIDLIAFYTGAAAITLLFNTVTAILVSGQPEKRDAVGGPKEPAEDSGAPKQG